MSAFTILTTIFAAWATTAPALSEFNITSHCDSAAIVTAPLLSPDYDNTLRRLTPGGNVMAWPADHAFANVAVARPDTVIETPVMLSATQPLVIDSEGRVTGSAIAPHRIAAMLKVVENFEMADGIASRDDYADWRKYLDTELNTLLPRRLAEAFVGVEMPAADSIFTANELTRRYYGGRLLTFAADAKRFHNITPQALPREYYRFLNNLDYTPGLLTPLTWGLYRFCDGILSAPALDIEPIGELDPAAWKRQTAEKLRGVIDNPPALLLDLLAATAYLRQQQPLTATQLKNSQALPSGLAQIVATAAL